MSKKITALFFSIATLWSFSTLSQGQIQQLSPFTSVNLNSTGKIILTQDTGHSFRVEHADENKKVNATIKGKILSVEAPSGATVYISMKEIEELTVSGWGSISSESPVKSENLRLSV